MRRATVGGDGTLTVTQLVPEDAGKYFCTASSVGGAIKITADMNLIVLKSEWHISNFWFVTRQLMHGRFAQVYSEIFQIFFEPSNSAVPLLANVFFLWWHGLLRAAIECEVPVSGSEATGGAKPSRYRT